MKLYEVTIEDDTGEVYEGTVSLLKLEINDNIRIKLHTRAPQYKRGTVIMFQEVSHYE